MDIQPKEKKALLRAVGVLKALEKERSHGTLDAAAMAYVQDAEDLLASRTGRVVTAIFMEWERNGQIRIDPRDPASLVSGARKSNQGSISDGGKISNIGRR